MDEESCVVCASKLLPADYVICCSGICARKFHLKCVNISHKDSQVIASVKNAKWYCDGCIVYNQTALQLIEQFNVFKLEISKQLQEFRANIETKICRVTQPEGRQEVAKNEQKTYSEVAKNVVIIQPKTSQNIKITKEETKKHCRWKLELSALKVLKVVV